MPGLRLVMRQQGLLQRALSCKGLLPAKKCLFRLLCIFWITCFCKYFFPVCGLSAHSLDVVFHKAEVYYLNEVQPISDFFHGSCL